LFKLRSQILLFLFIFGFAPLTAMVATSLPFVLERIELFYHKAHLQNLRADFRDLDEHLASRHEMARLLAKLPEPSLILGKEMNQDAEAIDEARVRYTAWINQILRDHLDIIQILFLDDQARPRFWLELNPRTQQWEPTIHNPDMPSRSFFDNGMQQEYGGVSVSKISLNPVAALTDPRRFMTLRLFSSIIGRGEEAAKGKLGAVVLNIDVGGMARAYRNTLWVTNDGTYLQDRLTGKERSTAFDDFEGLEQIFAEGKLALWEGRGRQVIWVPLFMTEDSGPLWVGRSVDPSPVSQFRNNLIIRVMTIALLVLVIVLVSARWIALSVSRFGQSLTEQIGRVLRQNEPVTFNWRGSREIRSLGRELTALAETHARQAREQLEHARQLEESNRYKSEFLANVSHELRTPLNSILLLSKILREVDTLSPEQHRQLQVIHEAGSDLKGLIEDILDLSKIEAGEASFSLEQIPVRQLLEELRQLVRPQFDAKGLYLRTQYSENLPQSFVSDLSKVRQIMKNFLSNALKFTPRGGVVMHAYRQTGESQCPLCLAVVDSGIGIAPDKHDLIFEAFKQADGSTSREYGGTGLGLSISRKLADLLGGYIRLESEEDRGSTFTLCLPLEYDGPLPAASDTPRRAAEKSSKPLLVRRDAAEPVPETGSVHADFAGVRVLLVDDDLRNLLALTPLLEGWGIEVTAAGDGNEALETLTEDADFSLVLMDIMMPERDGYDTIMTIRADPRLKDMAIVALSAHADAQVRDRCRNAGADDFLAKPVDPVQLEAVLQRHLAGETASSTD
jgi:signal transduction histidine kinase/CheY-like chemotaxis protein